MGLQIGGFRGVLLCSRNLMDQNSSRPRVARFSIAAHVRLGPSRVTSAPSKQGIPANLVQLSNSSKLPDMTTHIDGIDDLESRVGQHLGYSDWHTITPEQVRKFAEATGDFQWIHLDEERAKSGPFGTTIAHGYLTLSLAPMCMAEAFAIAGDVKMGVNYGANKLRFTAPVPVGSKVRMGAELKEVSRFDGGAQYTAELVFEIEGSERPACVAECIYRAYT